MDAHLTTLATALDAITDLQQKSPHTQSRRPFTAAVLNTYKLDVLDFIRDADAFEARLFWYPPHSAAGPSKGTWTKSTGTHTPGRPVAKDEAPQSHAIGAPRHPEVRTFEPPTPLRGGTRDSGLREKQEFDARVLLKAAQKLMDNYHNAPRARKHVKNLLRKHADLQKQQKDLEATIAENDTLISRLSNPHQNKDFVQSRRSTAQPERSVEDMKKERKKIAELIKKEEMEIMAIEQTTEELWEQKQSRPHENATETLPLDSQVESPGDVTETPDPLDTKETHPPIPTPASPPRDDIADETIRLPAPPAEQEDAPEPQDTAAVTDGLQTSDELERICENIWAILGDHLRFVLPDRDTANFYETLTALQSLSMSKGSPLTGDASTTSAQDATQSTVATTGSAASSATLPNSGPPTASIMIAAHSLAVLLMTPAPHVIDFDQLKSEADEWWTSVGSSVSSEAAPFSTTESLARKAIYDLLAKKLLKIRFSGPRRIVSFPANIT